MAALETEAVFVGTFWLASSAGHENTLRVAAALPPEVLEHEPLRRGFAVLAQRYAAGRPCALDNVECYAELTRAMGPEACSSLWDQAQAAVGTKIGPYVRAVLDSYRARRQAMLLDDAACEAKRLASEHPDRARQYGEHIAEKLVTIHAELPDGGAPQSQDELIDAEMDSMSAGGVDGISWPYPKLQRILGPILPGEAIGITGMPGSGKSTLLANLFNHWRHRNVACIVFPTEMREGWLRRAWTAEARVPQEIAEKRQWKLATPDQRENYKFAVEGSRGMPWEVVNRSEFTAEEIVARARVLRRRFPGRHVLVLVDHMHNLVYPGGEVDRYVGLATKRLREMAMDDQEGGMSVVLLFQPRKPEKIQDRYRAVRAHEIRGQVEQVLDTHISPFRRFVKTMANFKTPWGAPSALTDYRGIPEAAELDDPFGKPDDEHVYLKADKRRIGGEFGPTIMLHTEGPTGFIYEMDDRMPEDAAA